MIESPLSTDHLNAIQSNLEVVNGLILDSALPYMVHDQPAFQFQPGNLEMDSACESQSLRDWLNRANHALGQHEPPPMLVDDASEDDHRLGVLSGIVFLNEELNVDLKSGENDSSSDLMARLSSGTVTIDALKRMIPAEDTVAALSIALSLYTEGHDKDGRPNGKVSLASLHGDGESENAVMATFLAQVQELGLISVRTDLGENSDVTAETFDNLPLSLRIQMKMAKAMHRRLAHAGSDALIKRQAKRHGLAPRDVINQMLVTAITLQGAIS